MRIVAARVALLGFLALLVGCDHVTKQVAKARLEGAPPRDLVHGVLDLQYAENTDVAFNVLRAVPESTRRPILIAVGAVAVVALVAFLLRGRPRPRATQIALMLVTAGAVGNYVDRLGRGFVVDFVHLHHWPIFNVADVYVVAGAIMLAWMSIIRPSTGIERPRSALRTANR
jgi:signal peptidase II